MSAKTKARPVRTTARGRIFDDGTSYIMESAAVTAFVRAADDVVRAEGERARRGGPQTLARLMESVRDYAEAREVLPKSLLPATRPDFATWLGREQPSTSATTPKRASTALLVRPRDKRILCVWNRRYNGWALPGGLREPTDPDDLHGMLRELQEEAGVDAWDDRHYFTRVYEGSVEATTNADRAATCAVFAPTDYGFWREQWESEAREREPGCPVTWLTAEQFLRWSPFAKFYVPVFAMRGLFTGSVPGENR